MSKLKYSILFAFISISVVSQQYDSKFLDSLPENIRDDILAQQEQKLLNEEPQYRRPSSFIEKPNVDSKRFGINIFSMMQSTFMPLNEPNFDSDYILDFGDVIRLQLIGQGQRNSIDDLPINRDGSINLPELGKIYVAGISFEEASKLIKANIENSFIGVESFVTLINVRDIQVIVSGNVFNPGPYTLNGNSNVFHALSVSGGPSELGTFRDIDLIRSGEVIESIDLYDIFIKGKSSFGKRLRSGDLIFVKPAKKLVDISGSVKRPALYELDDGEGFNEILFFANGFTPSAEKNDIVLRRIDNNLVKSTKLDQENFKKTKLFDGDRLYVGGISIKSVTVSGAVKNPGVYTLNPSDGIFELIVNAGGYTQNAYEFGGILLNQSALEVARYAKDRLYKDFLNSLVETQTSVGSVDREAVIPLVEEIKGMPVSGRISAEFDLDKINRNKVLNTLLQNNDEVIIPERVNHLYVYGEVANEGATAFNSKNDLIYFINNMGGFTENADQTNIFVLSPDGTTQRVRSKNLFRDGRQNIELYPGSIIFIPRKFNNIYASQVIQSYASILGNLGVTLASLSVIKDWTKKAWKAMKSLYCWVFFSSYLLH